MERQVAIQVTGLPSFPDLKVTDISSNDDCRTYTFLLAKYNKKVGNKYKYEA